MRLAGKRVGVLVGPGFEDLEFYVPLMRMQEEGASVRVIGVEAGETSRSKSGGLTATSEVAARDVSAGDLDALIVPGGWAPDRIRRDPGVVALVRAMDAQQKVIGAICHAGSVLVSAGILQGRRATGSEGIKDDLILAGAIWTYDEPAFRDGHLVWGRVVPDIPAFCRELVAAIAESPRMPPRRAAGPAPLV